LARNHVLARPEPAIMTSLKVTFNGTLGAPIAARLELPPGDAPSAYALFAHCFTCGKDSAAAVRIARALAKRGIGVLRFDFSGLGESGGEFADSSFSTNVADLVAAAAFLRENYSAPQLLIGHSLGGAAVIAAAHLIGEAKAVATIGAPSDVNHVAHHFADQQDEIEHTGEAEVSLAGRPFLIRKGFLDDLRQHDQTERVAHLKRPLLILHSPTDAVVGIDSASQIFLAAKHPKSFVSLDGADHLLTRPADAAFAADMIAAWAARYLPGAAAAPDAPEQGVIAEETGAGRFQQLLSIGRHSLFADEPIALGGDDSGPNPYELVAAGLAACKSMTVRLYAARKNLPLDGISVRVNHDRVHAKDCADCEERGEKIDRFQAELQLVGDLNAEHRARLLEIADRCPVHRTLSHAALVETALKESSAP